MTTAGVPDAAALPEPPSTRWARHVGGLPRSYWFLFAGTLINRVGSFVTPFLTLYLTGGREVSVAQAGLVVSLLGLGSAVGQPVGGVLADRIGRRRTMVLGLVSSAATLLALGAAPTLGLLAGAAFAYGLALDLFRPAVQAAIADLVAEPDRVRAFALQFWAVNLGFSIATPLGGFLASEGYWLLFVLDAATCVLFALLILRAVPETRPIVTGAAGRFRDVLADRLMLALVLSVVAISVVYSQAFVTLPLVFGLDGLGPAAYGLAIGLNGVLIIVLQPLLLGAIGRHGRGPVLLCAMVLQGVGFALHGLADAIPMHLAAITVWTVGEVLQAGQLGALVAAIAPVHLRGRYMGVFGFAFGAAWTIGPLLGTQVLSRSGEAALWSGALALSVAAGVGLLLVSAAAGRRPQPAESA